MSIPKLVSMLSITNIAFLKMFIKEVWLNLGLCKKIVDGTRCNTYLRIFDNGCPMCEPTGIECLECCDEVCEGQFYCNKDCHYSALERNWRERR